MYNYIEKIRDFVNNSHHIEVKHNALPYRNKNDYTKKYYHLCSAMDIMGDTDEAISSYLELENKKGRGLNYIYIYGILQVLRLRSLAVKTMYNIFIPKKEQKIQQDDEILEVIRVLRNKLVAHPFDDSLGNGGAFGIAASGLNTFEFSSYRFNCNHGEENNLRFDTSNLSLSQKLYAISDERYIGRVFFDVRELITNQNSALEKYLDEICQYLDMERTKRGMSSNLEGLEL